MNAGEALRFVRRHGVVLMSARGPVPNLAEAIAGGTIRGSWWAHPQSRRIYRVLEGVRASDQVLVCRLLGGKITFVHRRLWPALVRLAGRLPKRGLAAVEEEHTARGHHRTVAVPFPRWVPKSALHRGKGLDEAVAVAQFGAGLFRQISGRTGAPSKGGERWGVGSGSR